MFLQAVIKVIFINFCFQISLRTATDCPQMIVKEQWPTSYPDSNLLEILFPSTDAWIFWKLNLKQKKQFLIWKLRWKWCDTIFRRFDWQRCPEL